MADIVPLAVAPEQDNGVASLEVMPLKMNREKSVRLGQSQRALARKFHAAGWLTEARLAEMFRR